MEAVCCEWTSIYLWLSDSVKSSFWKKTITSISWHYRRTFRMKGIILTGLIEKVESWCSLDIVEKVIESADLQENLDARRCFGLRWRSFFPKVVVLFLHPFSSCFLLIFLVFLPLYAGCSSILVYVATGMANFEGGRCWNCLLAVVMDDLWINNCTWTYIFLNNRARRGANSDDN